MGHSFLYARQNTGLLWHTAVRPSFHASYDNISHLFPLLSIQCMSRRDLSVKGETSERCYRTRRGWTDEQRYAIISPHFDGRIKMNGPYPEITNISSLAKLFFKTFISLKHLSDYRTIGLSDYRTVGLLLVRQMLYFFES